MKETKLKYTKILEKPNSIIPPHIQNKIDTKNLVIHTPKIDIKNNTTGLGPSIPGLPFPSFK